MEAPVRDEHECDEVPLRERRVGEELAIVRSDHADRREGESLEDEEDPEVDIHPTVPGAAVAGERPYEVERPRHDHDEHAREEERELGGDSDPDRHRRTPDALLRIWFCLRALALSEDLLRGERLGSPWVVSTAGSPSSPAEAAGSAARQSSNSLEKAPMSAYSTTAGEPQRTRSWRPRRSSVGRGLRFKRTSPTRSRADNWSRRRCKCSVTSTSSRASPGIRIATKSGTRPTRTSHRRRFARPSMSTCSARSSSHRPRFPRWRGRAEGASS